MDYFDCSFFKLFIIALNHSNSINDPASELSFDYFRMNFMGQRLSTTHCRYCETKLNCFEDMIDVCVPIPPDGEFNESGVHFIEVSCVTVSNQSIPSDDQTSISLQNACVTSERFEDSNKIRCEECQRKTEAVQSTTFPRLPRIMIVHLGRFDNRMNKTNTEIPIRYGLKCFCSACKKMPEGTKNEDHEYRLYGVIVHLGVNPTSGHYMVSINKNT